MFRQGIGTKLVLIGCKVAAKWNETEVYVAVDVDNVEAIRLYEKLNFETQLDERDNIFFSSRKKPRLFMRRNLL